MMIVKVLVVGLLAILVSLALLVAALVAFAMSLLNSGVSDIGPSDEALQDIPAPLLQAYIQSTQACPGLPWTVVAGIGKVESNHGRIFGGQLQPNGDIVPPILGVILDGSTPGTRPIPVPAGGSPWHNHPRWDRALGPMQFLTDTFRAVGVDGNGDGVRTPHNAFDAIHSATRYLCPDGSVSDVEAAIFRYNRSQSYVDDVLEWSSKYTGTVSATPIAGYALPLPGVTRAQAARPHHDYPAWDAGVPVGTPIFAMVDGEVIAADGSQPVYRAGRSRCGNIITISGIDQVTYTYCHLSAVVVARGQRVVAGQQIGLSGGQPGAPGAGNTTGPHLHLGMRGQGRSLCPQPVLISILEGAPINPLSAPSSGCIN